MTIIHQSSHGELKQIKWSDYRGTKAVNPSSLAEGLRDYLHVDVRAIHNAMTGQRKEPAQASQDRMDRGTVVHMALLQPERLQSDIAVWDGKVRKGAEWDAFEHDNDGKLIMRKADFDRAMEVSGLVRNHELVGGMLVGTLAEVAMFSTDCGVDVRGQVDAVNLKKRVIIDVKTTDSGVCDKECERTIRSLHYREKMGLYRRWISRITETDPASWKCYDLFIQMDQDCPAINLVRLLDDGLRWAELRMINALQKYVKAIEDNDFPIYASESCVAVAPWEMSEESEVIDD